jgi:hypothetical protein
MWLASQFSMLLRCSSKLIVFLRHEAYFLNAASHFECMRLVQRMIVAESRIFLADIRTLEFVVCIARTSADLIELNRRVIQTSIELARSDKLLK